MLWTKIKSGFKGFKSAFSAVLLVLLLLLSSLFFSSPVSAYTLSATTKRQITGVTYSTPNQSISDVIYNNSNSAVKFIIGNTGATLWSTSNVYLTINVSIPANSIASVSMSVSGANTGSAPQCFSGDGRQQVIDCDINGDNGNYTVSALFYITTATSTLNLYSYTPNQNLGMGNGIVVDIGPVVTSTVNAEGLSSQDITDIKFRLSQIDQWTFDSAVRLETIIPMIQDIIDAQSDAQAEQEETNDKLDRQWQQEQQDRQDYEDAVDDSETGAQDAGADVDNASSTIVGNISSIITAIINSPSTDCMLSVHTGASGVLQLNNMNLCSAPPEVLNLIHVISGIVVTLAVLWTAYNLFGVVMGIFETIQGGKLNG